MTKQVVNENWRDVELNRSIGVAAKLTSNKAHDGYMYGRSCFIYEDENDNYYITDDDEVPFVTKIGDIGALSKYFEDYA